MANTSGKKRTSTPDNNDLLVNNVSLLCNLPRKFHCKKRERELKSLTKYLTHFKNFSAEEFVNFVCRQYIQCLRARKRFCSQSIFNRVCAIQNRLDINVMTLQRYTAVIKSLRKLFNPYNNETDFYTHTGALITIPPEEFKQLRENAKYLIEQNETNVADRWVLNTYTDQEIEIVYRYFKMNLENFINTDRLPSSFDMAFIELCMLIVFNYNTPRRIAEIINLTMGQIEELIVRNTVNIKSKDGFSIDCIYVSVALADLLNRFVTKLYPNAFESSDKDYKIFNYSYKVYYGRMRKTLKTLIGEHRLKNLRIFHGFRNYFANRHIEQGTECQRILGHRSMSTTRKYAHGQKQANKYETKKQSQVLEYLNKI